MNFKKIGSFIFSTYTDLREKVVLLRAHGICNLKDMILELKKN